MDTEMDRATADALASPLPSGKPRFNLTERVKKTFRPGSFFGVSSPNNTQDSNLKALESAATSVEDRVEYYGSMSSLSGVVNVPFRKTPAQIETQLEEHRSNMEFKEDEQRLQQAVYESYQGDRKPAAKSPTIKDHPEMAELEARLRAVKEASAKQDLEISQESKHQEAIEHADRYNTLTNQIAYEEQRFAMNKRNRAAKAPPASAAPVRTGVPFAALTGSLAYLTSKVGATASRAGVPLVPEEPNTVSNYPPDPRLAQMQAKFEELEARLTGPEQQVHHQPAYSASDLAVMEMMEKVAHLEDQFKRQAIEQSQPAISDPSLRGSDPRMSELEATVQRLAAEMANTTDRTFTRNGTGTGGILLDEVRPPSDSFPDQDQFQARITPGDSTAHTVTPPPTSGHVTLQDIAPSKKDLSIGDEVYGISIRVPKQVMDVLCPKGMSDTMKSQIAEAGLDVASLPGKYRSSGAFDMTDVHLEMATSLGQVMEQLGRDQGNSLRPRDLGYQSERRNALDTIKSQEQLLSFRDELEETSEEALDSSENQMRNVMIFHGLDPAVYEYYLTASPFPTLIRKTLEFYKSLVDHIVTLSSKCGGFAHAQMDLQHYAHKLAVRRKGSHSRLEVLLKVYCELRDGHRNKFIDPKLQQKKNALLFARANMVVPTTPKATPQPPTADGSTTPKTKVCRRCGSKSHPNYSGCPLYHVDVPVPIARRIAVECQNANDFVAAAKAALATHLTNNNGSEGSPASSSTTSK